MSIFAIYDIEHTGMRPVFLAAFTKYPWGVSVLGIFHRFTCFHFVYSAEPELVPLGTSLQPDLSGKTEVLAIPSRFTCYGKKRQCKFLSFLYVFSIIVVGIQLKWWKPQEERYHVGRLLWWAGIAQCRANAGLCFDKYSSWMMKTFPTVTTSTIHAENHSLSFD